jgi:hypothetical protein
MFVNLVCDYNSYKLGNTSKKQISMESFLVLGSPAGNAKAVFEMVTGFLNIDSYFISAVPFFSAACGAGIGTKILLEIDIDSFFHRKKWYMDCHNGIHDVWFCSLYCIPTSF